MANLQQLKEFDTLTLDEVREHFPRALEGLRANYDFSFSEDSDAFREQFGVSTVEEAINKIVFYIVCYDGIGVAFMEPCSASLTGDVEIVWYPGEESDGEKGLWMS